MGFEDPGKIDPTTPDPEKPIIYTKYNGLPIDVAEEFLKNRPIYINPEKQKKELSNQETTINVIKLQEHESGQLDQVRANEIREKLGIPIQKERKENIKTSNLNLLNLENRKKLSGWNASYELAKIAQAQNLDLARLSREDYVQFAVDNSLKIDDDQLRMAPWQRRATSISELLARRKKIKESLEGSELDKKFIKFCWEIKRKAAEQDRFVADKIKVRQGTKDSSSWLFFGINNSLNKDAGETYKSYISVRDINKLTPEKFTDFMKALRDSGYNGDIKIFQDLVEQGCVLNDQIVMHGETRADAELSLKVAEKFFNDNLDQKSFGKDEVINGRNMSYSEILAAKIKNAVNAKV